MIKSFSSKRVKDIYNGINSRYSRSLPKELHNKAYRLLDPLIKLFSIIKGNKFPRLVSFFIEFND